MEREPRSQDHLLLKISKRVEYIVQKRQKNLEQLSLILEGGGIWLNCVPLSMEDIKSCMSPQHVQEYAQNFYILGISLGKILDLNNLGNIVKYLIQLFDEFELFTNGKLRINPIIAATLPSTLQSFMKNVKNEMAKHEQVKSNIKSLKSNFLGVRETDLSSKREATDLFEELPNSDYQEYCSAIDRVKDIPKSIRFKPVRIQAKNPELKMLVISNIPFDLDLGTISTTLCRNLMLVYNKFYVKQSLSMIILDNILKIDRYINKFVIIPLTLLLNETADALFNHEFQLIHNAL